MIIHIQLDSKQPPVSQLTFTNSVNSETNGGLNQLLTTR